ncbi:ABC transporter permease [Streptomyces sulphureus]|uniref:ABC transporter permease n=1 Tax=Streptomyces sulphureus TaxID=47758 RepID=UPI00037D78DB|nr:ABC transporter permease [Streptomyces sulphureus]
MKGPTATDGRGTPRQDAVFVRRPLRTLDRAAAFQRRRRFLEGGLAVLIPLALFALWELGARLGWIDARMFPAPTTILRTGASLLAEGYFWSDILLTLRRVLIGAGIGIVAGFTAGALMGLNRTARAALEPMLSAVYVVPKLALLPVFITIFGLGEVPLLVIISVTVFFYIWIYTMEAFASIPEGYHEAARSLDLGPVRMFTQVLVPAALPSVFVALRVAISVSIIVIVASEFLVGTTGVGYVIFDSRRLFMNDQMYVGIVTVSLMGVVLSMIVQRIGRLVTPWVKHSRRID